MSAKTIAEVLHLHGDWWWDGKAHCDGCHWSHASTILQAAAAFREHQADRLSAAGFGLVADAKAEALEEAAAIFAGRLPNGTGNGRAYNSYQVADMLRARAAAIRATP